MFDSTNTLFILADHRLEIGNRLRRMAFWRCQWLLETARVDSVGNLTSDARSSLPPLDQAIRDTHG